MAVLQRCSQPHKKLRVVIECNARGLDAIKGFPINGWQFRFWEAFYDLKNFEEVVIEFTDEKSLDAERLFGPSIKPSAEVYSSSCPRETRFSIYMAGSWLRKSLGESVQADGDAPTLIFRPQDPLQYLSPYDRRLSADSRNF